ncbi:MAG: aminodeoxychorismate synthase component I [Acidobacteria bacterium]|nr:aminodeoxychorismate synthase component I [Acidobacteriota bacterium]
MAASVAHCRLNLTAEQILAFILKLPDTFYPTILDSCKYQDYGLYSGRFLIAGYNPESCLQITNQQAYLFSRSGENIINGNALDVLDEMLDERRPKKLINVDLPLANSGAMGFFSYELNQYFEKLPTMPTSSHYLPDIFLCFYTTLIVYDYLTNEATLIIYGQSPEQCQTRLQAAQKQLERFTSSFAVNFSNLNIELKKLRYHSTFNKTAYLQAVEKIKNYIAEGDIYQANLTQQFQIELENLTAQEIFLRLRKYFPVPFSAYLKTPDWAVVSASPERFLHRQGKNIAAYPIKGTRPRGKDFASDKELAAELQSSEKDIAENIMIVDLLRNDLGRISELGTIDASNVLSLQALPTVFHLVSKVSGQIKENTKFSEILRATFPCGSITGAPKIRAMEILSKIEPLKRGLSMGAIGWVGYDGDLDLSVAIRTLFIQNNCGYFNVGGGIVADSDPLAEYQESLIKAEAMFQAIGLKV